MIEEEAVETRESVQNKMIAMLVHAGADVNATTPSVVLSTITVCWFSTHPTSLVPHHHSLSSLQHSVEVPSFKGANHEVLAFDGKCKELLPPTMMADWSKGRCRKL